MTFILRSSLLNLARNMGNNIGPVQRLRERKHLQLLRLLKITSRGVRSKVLGFTEIPTAKDLTVGPYYDQPPKIGVTTSAQGTNSQPQCV